MMLSTVVLIAVAIWSHSVQAHNDTLLHGWQTEPNGRGTWSILWSCLATIFICTWSALHLDVPKRPGGKYSQFFRKVGWMLIAAVVPEIVLFLAAGNFFGARDWVKRLRGQGNSHWILTHAQFVFAKGFRISEPQSDTTNQDESKPEPWDPEELHSLIWRGAITEPPVSEEELKSRGKSDWFIKLIAVLQILWFVIQTLVRAIQGYQTTPLEIMTVAFVFCSVFIYGFSVS
ncbi:hypothetical protein ACLMJK_008783 [Lecanora helva]